MDLSVNINERDTSGKYENLPGTADYSYIINLISCPALLSGMSHEMRTHMNSIVAFSFLMNNSDCSENERKQYNNHILHSCEQLIFLFDNFLDSAIIDTGNSKPEARSCNLDSLIDDLLSEFRVIIKRGDYPDMVLIHENHTTGHTDVLLDTIRVTRVLRSLLQNALFNTKSGYIKFGCNLNENTAIFYVLDSGDGFLKCREFLQTENLEESLKRHKDTPSAVSLIFARKLAGQLGGKLWIEHNGITGSALYFAVPVKPADSQSVSINKFSNTRIAI